MNASRTRVLWGWPQGRLEIMSYLYYHSAKSYGEIARGIGAILETPYSKAAVYNHLRTLNHEGYVDGFTLTKTGREALWERTLRFFGRGFFDRSISESNMNREETRYGLILLHGAEENLRRLGLLKGSLKESDLPRIAQLIAKSLEKSIAMEI